MSEKKENIKLLEYLNKLSQKYNNQTLTEEQAELFHKRIAEAVLFSDMMKRKRKLDPVRNAKEYLELEKDFNRKLRELVDVILAATDWAQFEGNPVGDLQLPLSEFLETANEIEENKLSEIKILKKGRGVNGHS
jgi:hypothetical protein